MQQAGAGAAAMGKLSVLSYYKTAQLFAFFAGILEQLLHDENCFVTLTRELHRQMYAKFLDLCDQHSQRIREIPTNVYQVAPAA